VRQGITIKTLSRHATHVHLTSIWPCLGACDGSIAVVHCFHLKDVESGRERAQKLVMRIAVQSDENKTTEC